MNAYVQCIVILLSTYLMIKLDCVELYFYPCIITVLALTICVRITKLTILIGDSAKNEKSVDLMVIGLLNLFMEIIAIVLFGISFAFYARLYFTKPAMVFVGL